MELVVNNGTLVNENDIDIKSDFDPTKAFSLQYATNITYKQIFLEVTQFINTNNGTDKKYLEYPKLYLQG